MGAPSGGAPMGGAPDPQRRAMLAQMLMQRMQGQGGM